MSSAATEATSPPPPPNPTLVLFARGVIARLEQWPALRIAVEQGWGGPESRAKQRWLASELVDAFDEQQPTPGRGVLEDEFGASVEDGSVEAVAADVVALWGAGEEAVREWERKAEGARAKRVDVREEVVDEEDEDEVMEDEEEDEDEVPQLSRAAGDSQQRPSKPEPVVDDDGFTLVQKRRR
ncbi:Pre-rRNA-processing protein TSR2-domain-containing protein [Lactarius indigo]|nr:Pre-rRNA-processing protein TSR2-domain-containing protein [Lactarius indigo]